MNLRQDYGLKITVHEPNKQIKLNLAFLQISKQLLSSKPVNFKLFCCFVFLKLNHPLVYYTVDRTDKWAGTSCKTPGGGNTCSPSCLKKFRLLRSKDTDKVSQHLSMLLGQRVAVSV